MQPLDIRVHTPPKAKIECVAKKMNLKYFKVFKHLYDVRHKHAVNNQLEKSKEDCLTDKTVVFQIAELIQFKLDEEALAIVNASSPRASRIVVPADLIPVSLSSENS